LRQKERKFRVEMRGGTPFQLVKIKHDEVEERKGAWQTLKRAFGFKVKSILEFLITPSIPTPSKSTTKQLPPSNTKLQAVERLPLTQILPLNIVLPTSTVTVVGIYRKLLLQAINQEGEKVDRLLPQSGILHHADALLSSFPRILADPAASKVLMMLWSKQFPHELNGRTFRDMTISDASNIRALQVFRSAVLQLWHAFSSPSAIPNKLIPFETYEDILLREDRIREIIGLPCKTLPADAASNVAASLTLRKSITTTALQQSQKQPQQQQQQNDQLQETRANSIQQYFTNQKTKKDMAKKELTQKQQGKIVGGVVVHADANVSQSLTVASKTAIHEISKNQQEFISVKEHLYTPFNARELLWTAGHSI
jgi:hypothetical protein